MSTLEVKVFVSVQGGTVRQLLTSISDLVNPKFLENYLNLNDYNKKIVEEITSGLIKMQKDENKNIYKRKAK